MEFCKRSFGALCKSTQTPSIDLIQHEILPVDDIQFRMIELDMEIRQ